MKKSVLIAAVSSLTIISAAAQAGVATVREARGYDACLAANGKRFERIVAGRDYYLNSTENGRIYYINATAWEQGERMKVGLSCETTKSGRRVLSHRVTDKQFVPATYLTAAQ